MIRIGSGSNDGLSPLGTRALKSSSGDYVPYDLYADSGFSTMLAINAVISPGVSTGVAKSVNLYGKAQGKAGLPAGTYVDAISVELTF